MTNKEWYIIYIGNPKKVEAVRTAFHDINMQDFTLWTPTQEVIQKDANGNIKSITRPMFPGYLFVNFLYTGNSIEDALYDLKAGFLLKGPGGTVPTNVTDEQIEMIKQLEKVRVEEGITNTTVAIGSFVELTNGPFIGVRGIVVGTRKGKVIVELVIFGRMVSVEVDEKHLNYVPSESELEQSKKEILKQRIKKVMDKT